MLIKNEKAADKAGQSTPPAQIIYNVLIISSVWARKQAQQIVYEVGQR